VVKLTFHLKEYGKDGIILPLSIINSLCESLKLALIFRIFTFL
jgi:hypothetical protein